MQPSNEHQAWDALSPGHQKWNELDGHAKEAAAILGYTEETWNPENWGQGQLVVSTLLKDKHWNELMAPQRDAAKILGLSEERWEHVHNIIHNSNA